MGDPGQHIASRDKATAAVGCERHGTLLQQTLVRAPLVVVCDERGEHPAQVAFVQDEQVVLALPAGGADPALGHRVRPRRPVGRPYEFRPLAPEDSVETSRELRVPIADQEPAGQGSILDLPAQLPGLLRHAGGGRLRGAAGEMHPVLARNASGRYAAR